MSLDMRPFDIALFAAAVRLAAPLLLAAIGELVSERAGVINIGLEGMMLAGAFTGFLGVHATGSTVVGLLTGVLGGLIVGALMALFSITLGGDQIVVGVALNLFVGGSTLFAYRLLFVGAQPSSERMSPWAVPLLSDVPLLGPVLFTQLPVVYLAFALVPAIALLLARSRTGLMIRATGEMPAAVTAAGCSPVRTQWAAVLLCAALAGTGGAFLSVVQLGLFAENMTAGRGFLALAAVVFGRWRPLGVMLACLVFGFTDALQLRLQSVPQLPGAVWVLVAVAGAAFIVVAGRGVVGRAAGAGRTADGRSGRVAGVVVGLVLGLVGLWGVTTAPAVHAPSQLWLSLPYVLSLVVLALAARSSRAPSMVGRSLRSVIDARS